MSAFNPLAFLLAQERNFPKVKQTQWCERQSKITSLIRQNSLRNPWVADAQGGTNPIELADTDGEGKPLGKLLLNLVAWRVRSLSARLFQKPAHFASHFGWMSMPAFLQRLLPSLAHPLAQPIGC